MNHTRGKSEGSAGSRGDAESLAHAAILRSTLQQLASAVRGADDLEHVGIPQHKDLLDELIEERRRANHQLEQSKRTV